MKRRRGFSSSAGIFVAFEVSVWVMVIAFFVALLGAADIRIVIPVLVLRTAVAFALWRSALAPIHAWRRRVDDDQLLVAADQAFSRFYQRFGLTYAASWAAAGIGALLLGALGIPEPLPVGAAEQLAAVMGTLGMALGVGSVVRPFCDAYLPGVRAEVGAALLERGLGARRATESVGRRLLLFNLALLAAVALGLLAMAVLERANGERGRVQAEQRGRVAEVALKLRAGTIDVDAPELDELELVAATGLPVQLGVDPTKLDQAVAVVDPRRGSVLAAAPVGDGRFVLAQAEVELGLRRTTLGAVVFLSLMLVLVGVANMILNRTVTAPLEELDDAVRRMVEEGDIRALARVVPLRGDELGALSHNFNRLLDGLDALASAAGTVADGNLDVELEGRGDLQDAFSGMLARLHEMVLEVRSASLEVARAGAEIQATTKTQELAVDQQARRMEMFTEAVVTLARSAEQISATATEVLDNAEQTLAMTSAMTSEITELDAQANNIGELLELIREIADRSDLLALNGSLEATRAGEAGRGFALVAAEMRRLAERVTGTVGTVRERVASISAAGSSTVEATDRSRKLANDTAAAAQRISRITQEQSAQTERVSLEVLEVANDVSATVASMAQTQEAAEGLRRQAAELERLTARFKLREVDTEPRRARRDRG